MAHRSQLPRSFSQAFIENHWILTWGKAPSPSRGIYWVIKVKARKYKCPGSSSESREGHSTVNGSRLAEERFVKAEG